MDPILQLEQQIAEYLHQNRKKIFGSSMRQVTPTINSIQLAVASNHHQQTAYFRTTKWTEKLQCSSAALLLWNP